MEWTAVSSTLPPHPLGSDVVAAVRSAPYLHPCFPGCRFYELPWALIHLCHTQAPLLGLLLLLANWLGCRWEGPAGHIRFLQRRTKPLRAGRRKKKRKTEEEVVIWVWTEWDGTMLSACLQKYIYIYIYGTECENVPLLGECLAEA